MLNDMMREQENARVPNSPRKNKPVLDSTAKAHANFNQPQENNDSIPTGKKRNSDEMAREGQTAAYTGHSSGGGGRGKSVSRGNSIGAPLGGFSGAAKVGTAVGGFGGGEAKRLRR